MSNSNLVNLNIKHGDSKRGNISHLYYIWGSMRYRCNNPNHEKYKNYGARGIKVCPEWDNLETGYINFRNWALKNGYRESVYFTRLDNTKDYCPENCIFKETLKSKEKVKTPKIIKIKHGGAVKDKKTKHKSHLYSIWTEMRYRCNNPNHSSYKNYGARGIKVCPEWDNLETGYINFRNWALKNGYRDGLSIERIDISFGYFPENCTWLTIQEQQYNRQNTCYGIIGHYAFPIIIWAEIMGVSSSTIYNRIHAYHWSIEDAILTPPGSEKGNHVDIITIPLEYLKYNKYEILKKHGKLPDDNEELNLTIHIVDDTDIL